MDSHQAFFKSLDPEEEQLLLVRDFLYAGSWEELVQDLTARLEGKPFVFKLSSRIEDDLRRIEKLRRYEESHAIDLGRYLVECGKYPELLSDTTDEGGEGSQG